ncbi:hypothetical protein GWK48_10395 [Metallosphaera tengchongensis]|uniref:CRISPR type III-associated protein domain-containing protein n=1 Tax=Metallosphaera tengchongensis TaxID=1532350 RepID=A0A6N0NVJ2_9CREN|nr:RAMP superfamily CRISPR-associated protein [Metallosphaera tengchongensis]QKR00742.1 hypothetical protein GWK48_10395 [Metallosphaera tengchongensis]
MSISSDLQSHTYRLRLKTRTHVGGGPQARPSIIDLKVWRARTGNGEDKLAIPSSTIKGVMRTRFENEVRRKTFEAIKKSYGSLEDFLYCFLKQFTANVMNYSIDSLKEDLKKVIPKNNRLYSGYYGLGTELPSFLDLHDEELSALVSVSVYDFFPIICDPTSQLSCLSDKDLLGISENEMTMFTLLLQIALAKKLPFSSETCTSCEIFGANGLISAIKVSDFIAITNIPVIPVQARISVDRLMRAVSQAKLFSAEYIPEDIEFKGRIELMRRVPYLSQLDSILDNLANLIQRVGRWESLGFGEVEVLDVMNRDDRFIIHVIRSYIDYYKQNFENSVKKVNFILEGENRDKIINAMNLGKSIIEKIEEGLGRS